MGGKIDLLQGSWDGCTGLSCGSGGHSEEKAFILATPSHAAFWSSKAATVIGRPSAEGNRSGNPDLQVEHADDHGNDSDLGWRAARVLRRVW